MPFFRLNKIHFDRKAAIQWLEVQKFCYLSIRCIRWNYTLRTMPITHFMISKNIFQCGIFPKNLEVFLFDVGQNQIKCAAMYKQKKKIFHEIVRFMMMKKAKKKNKLSTEYCWYLIFDNDSDGAKTMFLLIETHWALSVLIRWQATERERHIDKHGQNRMLHEKRIVRYIWTWNVFRLIISQWAKTMHRIERVNAWWCSCAREKAKMYFYNQKAFVHVNG